jgi:hypothetical protein
MESALLREGPLTERAALGKAGRNSYPLSCGETSRPNE